MSRERLRWLVWLLAVLLAVILLADEWLAAQRSWRGDLELVFPEAIASVCNVTVVGITARVGRAAERVGRS